MDSTTTTEMSQCTDIKTYRPTVEGTQKKWQMCPYLQQETSALRPVPFSCYVWRAYRSQAVQLTPDNCKRRTEFLFVQLVHKNPLI